jgi:hypothetical protein
MSATDEWVRGVSGTPLSLSFESEGVSSLEETDAPWSPIQRCVPVLRRSRNSRRARRCLSTERHRIRRGAASGTTTRHF